MSKKINFHPISFPYVRFHDAYYPLIPVTLKRGRTLVRTFALIDSGASFSVFRPEIARALKIHQHKKKPVRLGTANGGVDIALERVQLEVGPVVINSTIGFTSTQATTFNIIGRHGFFSKFSICFNEIMKTVVLVPLSSI